MISPNIAPCIITTSATDPISTATAHTGKSPLMASTTATLESMSRSASGSRIWPSRVGPARRASLPSRKSVAAASTKNAAANASARASSSTTTTGTMKRRERERALGTVNTRSPKGPLESCGPGIALTAALNPHPYAHPPQIIPLPQRVLHVAQILTWHVLWPAREEGESRGRRPGLGRVADLDSFRRRGAAYEPTYELGNFVRGK